jgi:hypothetical protein
MDVQGEHDDPFAKGVVIKWRYSDVISVMDNYVSYKGKIIMQPGNITINNTTIA